MLMPEVYCTHQCRKYTCTCRQVVDKPVSLVQQDSLVCLVPALPSSKLERVLELIANMLILALDGLSDESHVE